MWSNAIDSNDIFNEDETIVDNVETHLKAPDKNSFIKIKYHWSEDPTKDEDWYVEQKRELNFDTRSINQELDLKFIGSTSCIFDDDLLSNLQSRKPKELIKLGHYSTLKLFSYLDPNEYYIIGVDTAKSLTGDYCAIEVFEYNSFKQVAEFFNRTGSLTKFTEIIVQVVKYIAERTNNRFVLAIENNSIGTAIIENLENLSESDSIDYINYVFSNSKDEFKYGINTNVKTKDQMVTIFYDYINDDPSIIKSSDLIDQFSVIEKRANGSVAAKSNQHDDLFMASCFCAYLKKQTLLDSKYLPLDSVQKKQEESIEDRLISNIIIKNPSSKNIFDSDEFNIFRSERDLIKTMDDFDDFSF